MDDLDAESANVISLIRARNTRPDPALRDVEAYWEALRNGRAVPPRAEVDPRGLAHVLDKTFLLERLAPGLARFRVAGRAIVATMGMELTGMPISTCFLPEARPRLGRALDQVFEGPALAHLNLDAPRGFRRGALTGQMLLLPLTDQDGATTRILGCLVTTGRIGRKPRRFEIGSATARRIVGSEREEAARTSPLPQRPTAADRPAGKVVPFPALVDH